MTLVKNRTKEPDILDHVEKIAELVRSHPEMFLQQSAVDACQFCDQSSEADAAPPERDWRTMGIVELAAENQSVREYIETWEARALKAETASHEWVPVVKALVDKLDECRPHINRAFVMWQSIRGGSYTGPDFADELAAAKALLARRTK
jgi:hypothetical protein